MKYFLINCHEKIGEKSTIIYSLKTIYLTTLFFLLVSSNLYAQFTKIEGIIKDSITEHPIQYAHIFLNKEVGTISNKDGEFELKWNPKAHNSLELFFSSIGYKDYTIRLFNRVLDSSIVVDLVPSITILDEIVVSSLEKADSGKLIMQKVVKNIHNNYSFKKYGLEVFYREANISDDSYSRLIESQLFIADKGYNKPIETIKMNALQMRKTEDNRDLSWRQSLFEWLYMKNGAFKTLANDRVKLSAHAYNSTDNVENKNGWIQYDRSGHKGSIRFLSKEFIDGCDWELKDVRKAENDTTYVLQYETINKNKSSSFARIGKGTFYISKKDWGVNEIRSEVVKPVGVKYHQLDYTLKNSRAYYKTIIKYQKHEGKYYLSYIKSESIGTNSTSMFGGRDWSLFTKTKGRLGKIYQENELFVTRIVPFKKIARKNRMDKEDDLYNVEVKNNTAFWATYNYPLLNPLTDKMKNDLKNNDGELFIKD